MEKMRKQTWDLETLFPGGSRSEKFAAFLSELEQNIQQESQYLTNHPAPQTEADLSAFLSFLERLQDIGKRVKEALSFVNCLTAQDVHDNHARLLSGTVSGLNARFLSLGIQFDRQLLEIPDGLWEKLLTYPSVQPIAFNLKERRRRIAERLAPEMEMLVNDLQVSGYHAWSDLYDLVSGRISIPIEQDGEMKRLSAGQASNLLSHGDRTVRQTVFAKWEQAWAEQAPVIAHALNHLAGFRLSLYRKRGWDNVIQEPLDINRMKEETLRVMWDVIGQNKQVLVDYLHRKAKMLGLSQLSWYDLDAPLGNQAQNIPYERAVSMILEQFQSFSPKMARFAEQAFEKNWIEAENRPGKRAGGFCTSFPVSRQTRVFMTYANSSSNVATLAHELGHAFHQHVMDDLPQMAQGYAMNVAETASTLAEMIVADASVKQAKTTEEKLGLLDDKAHRAVTFFMNIHARFLFESRFYEERKNGLLSVDRLNELMLEAQQTAYCGALEQYHPLFWASKLHFYITRVPFYNFPYTFGYLFSTGIYAHAMKTGNAFEDHYINLLRDTGRLTVEELAMKHLGVDLTQPEFWQSACDVALQDVHEFLRLTS